MRKDSAKAQFVGCDDHIDPRSEENNLGAPARANNVAQAIKMSPKILFVTFCY